MNLDIATWLCILLALIAGAGVLAMILLGRMLRRAPEVAPDDPFPPGAAATRRYSASTTYEAAGELGEAGDGYPYPGARPYVGDNHIPAGAEGTWLPRTR